MFTYFQKLSPDTLRVVADFAEFSRLTGRQPTVEEVEARAGAHRSACLVLVLGVLRARDGSVVELVDGCAPAAIVPDAETAYAILVRGGARVQLEQPERRRKIPMRKLPMWASARSYCR